MLFAKIFWEEFSMSSFWEVRSFSLCTALDGSILACVKDPSLLCIGQGISSYTLDSWASVSSEYFARILSLYRPDDGVRSLRMTSWQIGILRSNSTVRGDRLINCKGIGCPCPGLMNSWQQWTMIPRRAMLLRPVRIPANSSDSLTVSSVVVNTTSPGLRTRFSSTSRSYGVVYLFWRILSYLIVSFSFKLNFL